MTPCSPAWTRAAGPPNGRRRNCPRSSRSVNHGNKTFAVHTSRNVIIYNKQRVKPADAPKEWTDLWDPKWKGKVGMDPPWRSIAVQGLVAFWVKNGIPDAAQKLKANDVRFFEGSAGVFQAVLRGDVMVATLADLPLEPGLEDGAPIGFVYPKSGTATNDGYVMVSGRAPHPNAGKVFVNWLMSAPGQLVLQEQGGLPVTRPGVTPTEIRSADLGAVERGRLAHDRQRTRAEQDDRRVARNLRHSLKLMSILQSSQLDQDEDALRAGSVLRSRPSYRAAKRAPRMAAF